MTDAPATRKDIERIMRALRQLRALVNGRTPIDVVANGRKGGCARAKKLTPEERSASARKAAAARWGKRKES